MTETDSRWTAMCKMSEHHCGADLLGVEECKSPFGLYELRIPVDKNLPCDDSVITDKNCKDLDVSLLMFPWYFHGFAPNIRTLLIINEDIKPTTYEWTRPFRPSMPASACNSLPPKTTNQRVVLHSNVNAHLMRTLIDRSSLFL